MGDDLVDDEAARATLDTVIRSGGATFPLRRWRVSLGRTGADRTGPCERQRGTPPECFGVPTEQRDGVSPGAGLTPYWVLHSAALQGKVRESCFAIHFPLGE